MLDRSSQVEVVLRLAGGPDTDDEELERGTEQLRRRLLELDVEDVRRPPRGVEAPEGTRAVDPITLGALVIQLAPAFASLYDVVQTVRAWLSHYPDRSASLEIDGDRIEVTGISLEDQRDLIRLWTDRHSRG